MAFKFAHECGMFFFVGIKNLVRQLAVLPEVTEHVDTATQFLVLPLTNDIAALRSRYNLAMTDKGKLIRPVSESACSFRVIPSMYMVPGSVCLRGDDMYEFRFGGGSGSSHAFVTVDQTTGVITRIAGAKLDVLVTFIGELNGGVCIYVKSD